MRPLLVELAEIAREIRILSSRLDAVLALAKGRESASMSGVEQVRWPEPGPMKDGGEAPSESETPSYDEVF